MKKKLWTKSVWGGSDVTRWNRISADIKRAIFMTLVGARSASLLRHMSAPPGTVFGMQTEPLECWWGLRSWTGFESGRTSLCPPAARSETSLICWRRWHTVLFWCFGRRQRHVSKHHRPQRDTTHTRKCVCFCWIDFLRHFSHISELVSSADGLMVWLQDANC